MPTDMKSFASTILTLAEALEQAGGVVDVDCLDKMRAIDLIRLIAPNGIRFTYDKKLVVR